MGLEDIDLDGPPLTKSTTTYAQEESSAPSATQCRSNIARCPPTAVDLGDLFGDLTVSRTSPPTAAAGGNGGTADSGTSADHPENTFDNDLEWTTVAPSVTPPALQKCNQGNSVLANDPLDSFFAHAVPMSAGAGGPRTLDSSNDLFDFSKPTERARYANESTTLEAFANQGRGPRGNGQKGPTLADLSKGSSDNVMKARLLKLMNYYDILGVAPDATESVIRQKFKRKALELHPDRVGRDQTPEEVELFKVMTKAHEVLADPEERAKYDAQLFGCAHGVSPESDWMFPPS